MEWENSHAYTCIYQHPARRLGDMKDHSQRGLPGRQKKYLVGLDLAYELVDEGGRAGVDRCR